LVNDQNVVVDSAEEMSQEFNKFFSSVFTKERTGEVPEANGFIRRTIGLMV